MVFNHPLPSYTPQRLAVKLRPAGEKAVRRGHPWVFDEAIEKLNKTGIAGDICIIFDRKKNKFLGIGLYDPHSPIRIKLLHSGKSVTIDKDWFFARITEAHSRRKPLLSTDTNSYRLIYGENDQLPGLIADVYDRVLVVKLYSSIWLPYLTFLLSQLLAVSATSVLVLRLSRSLQRPDIPMHGLQDGQVLFGSLTSPEVVFREHGLQFIANVIHGHKTGYFLDHRHNRKRVGDLAKGKKVLDVFAYAGGFSVHALSGGATQVTSLDISAQALEMAKKNVALNGFKGRHSTIVADAFAGLAELAVIGETFDLIVIEPPSFAKRANERARALHSYQRLTRLAVPLLRPGGILLLASCSSRIKADEFFSLNEEILAGSNRHFIVLERTFHDVDHPIRFPEGAYLKAIYFQQK